MLIPLTLNRLNTFSTNLLLWGMRKSWLRNKPYAYGAERIYFNLGTELGQVKRYDESIAAFSAAIATHP